VVVNDFDIVGASIAPRKANAPLRVDPDAHLPGPITGQPLEPVAGRKPQIVQSARRIDLAQLSQRPILDVAGKLSARSALPDFASVAAPERPDHPASAK
jgi:hypothetical protein